MYTFSDDEASIVVMMLNVLTSKVIHRMSKGIVFFIIDGFFKIFACFTRHNPFWSVNCLLRHFVMFSARRNCFCKVTLLVCKDILFLIFRIRFVSHNLSHHHCYHWHHFKTFLWFYKALLEIDTNYIILFLV